LGSTTFNGQRCTAIKMIFVHASVADAFIAKLKEKVAALKAGLPWLPGTLITPLPEPGKIDFLQSLVEDAVSKGAAVVNADLGGGLIYGNIFVPAIVAPVTESMRLWHEEQFGPVSFRICRCSIGIL
jgi:glyceraldehyde-3-phosphate dehydrogenase (NADP+)